MDEVPPATLSWPSVFAAKARRPAVTPLVEHRAVVSRVFTKRTTNEAPSDEFETSSPDALNAEVHRPH
jgi:hypothetical protein